MIESADKRKVYVGYDPREHIASAVCCSSVRRRSQVPAVEIKLKDQLIRQLYRRPYERQGNQYIDGVSGKKFSTQFSFSRFLVPYLNSYSGWAVFCDCDFLFLASVDELFGLANEDFAVMVVKHQHDQLEPTKMDGVVQTPYGRKNWSSLVLWNCGHPANRAVTPGAVNREDGLWLHQFQWLRDDQIGALPMSWNYLVGVNTREQCPEVKAAHFTLGGPWFSGYEAVEFADEWRQEMLDYRED